MQTIGILGGGQLGRMLIQAGLDLEARFHVLDPDAQAPCAHIAHHFSVGDLKDFDAVLQFGQQCDIITIEIEKVNIDALKQLRAQGKKVYPQPETIETIQDKRHQKAFYVQHQIPTSPFWEVSGIADISQYASQFPLVNKLAKDGYDGRGVQILRTATDLNKAFDTAGLLEQLVNIQTEIAVIVARNPSGEVRTFPPVEMAFHPEANLVEYLFAPAQIPDYVAAVAEATAVRIAEKLDLVGLLAVEMFVTPDEHVIVNEAAPRPHNSGHATIEANLTSQFQQHLRAILDLPLGDTAMLCPSAMVNVLGEEGFSGDAVYHGLHEILAVSGVNLHLYGKTQTKPMRKMGHITILDPNIEQLRQKATFVKDTLKVKSK